jgi:hypothetical protein
LQGSGEVEVVVGVVLGEQAVHFAFESFIDEVRGTDGSRVPHTDDTEATCEGMGGVPIAESCPGWTMGGSWSFTSFMGGYVFWIWL